MNKFFPLIIFFSASATLADTKLKSFDLNFAENNEICVNQGEEFCIQAGLTVYPWNHQKWELVDAVCIQLIKEDFLRSSICMNPETGILGGAGIQIWTFKALKHGLYNITFKRIVPTKSLDGQIEEIKTIRVYVDPNWCGTKVPKAASDSEAKFLKAAQKGNLAKIKKLIEQGIDVNAQNERGETALMISSFYNEDRSIMQALLNAGANPNITSKNGSTVLAWLTVRLTNWPKRQNTLDIFEMLLAYGANPYIGKIEVITPGGSPLGSCSIFECINGHHDSELIDSLARFGYYEVDPKPWTVAGWQFR